MAAGNAKKEDSGYGRYLLFLDERGELDPILSPADRITPERLRAYVGELQRTTRGHSIQNRIQELGDAMRALAPEGDWRWILRAASRLRASTVPAINKRARLRPIQELTAIGFRLMDDAERDSRSVHAQALQYRDGLVIAFLGFHAIRLRNLVELELGRHIIEVGKEFLIQLPETKAKNSYEAMLVKPITERFRRYLDRYRPVLLAVRGRRHVDPGNALWISRRGATCGEDALAGIVRKHTGGDGKLPLSPHLVRTCAATSVAVWAPESVDIIPAILGQRSPQTYERYYNLATAVEASRAHSAVIDALRAELPSPPRGAAEGCGLKRQYRDPRGTADI
jgi:integrase/recombinase XerD